jgi:GNAT superfamily N-acetyltransferase
VPAATYVTLADGARVEVRAVEPTDTSLLEEVLEHLSPGSRYRRFLTHMERLSPRQLRELTTLDHDRQEALVAIDAATGEAVAVARYAALAGDARTAEIAVAASDPWQRRGLGTVLLNRLSGRARDHGITRFSGLMLTDNTAMQKLMTSIGPVISRTEHGGTVELVVGAGQEGSGGVSSRRPEH